MGTIFFVIKTTVVTALVILVMQIEWGGVTVEQRALHAIRTSSLTRPLEQAAQSVVRIGRDGWDKVRRLVGGDPSVARDTKYQLQRSKEYLKEKAEKSRKTAKQSINKFIDESRESSPHYLTSEEEDTQ